MTHLGEPQSAAGVPALVPDSRANQPWLARMDAHLGQMTLARSISFYSIAPGASPCSYRRSPDRLHPPGREKTLSRIISNESDLKLATSTFRSSQYRPSCQSQTAQCAQHTVRLPRSAHRSPRGTIDSNPAQCGHPAYHGCSCQRRTCVIVKRCVKRANSASCSGQSSRCQWFGISDQAQIHIGDWSRVSRRRLRTLGNPPPSRTTARAQRRDSICERPSHQERPALFVARSQHRQQLPHLVDTGPVLLSHARSRFPTLCNYRTTAQVRPGSSDRPCGRCGLNARMYSAGK